MKTIGITAACCLLGTGATFAYPDHSDKPSDHKNAHQKASGPQSASDFVSGAIDASQAELRAGQLALHKGQNPSVKQLGQTLLKDQKEIKSRLMDLAAKHNIQWKNSLQPEHQETLNKLWNASGSEFDRMFVQQVIKDHERDLAMIKECGDKFKDNQDLHALIQDYKPFADRHLKMARHAAETLGLDGNEARDATGAAATSERLTQSSTNPNREFAIDEDREVDLADKNEVLGLPTSNNDGTILGLIPAPSRTVEAGSRESYIAGELADGNVDPGVENVFQANQETVAAPSTFNRERSASKFTGGNNLPAEVHNAIRAQGWEADDVNVKRVTVFEVETDGQKYFATPDGKLYQIAD